jgi:hypothetical protein
MKRLPLIIRHVIFFYSSKVFGSSLIIGLQESTLVVNELLPASQSQGSKNVKGGKLCFTGRRALNRETGSLLRGQYMGGCICQIALLVWIITCNILNICIKKTCVYIYIHINSYVVYQVYLYRACIYIYICIYIYVYIYMLYWYNIYIDAYIRYINII